MGAQTDRPRISDWFKDMPKLKQYEASDVRQISLPWVSD